MKSLEDGECGDFHDKYIVTGLTLFPTAPEADFLPERKIARLRSIVKLGSVPLSPN